MGLSSIEELSVDKEELHRGLKEYEDFDLNTFLDLVQDIIFPPETAGNGGGVDDDNDEELDEDAWEEAAVVEAVHVVDGREYLKKKLEEDSDKESKDSDKE